MSNAESVKKADVAGYLVTHKATNETRLQEKPLDDLPYNSQRFEWEPLVRASTLEALQRENGELKQHVEELQEKINPEKNCACSYDEAGAVCAAHSPMLKAAEAEVKRLREALTKINEGYGPNHMSTYCRFTAKEALASAGEEHHAE